MKEDYSERKTVEPENEITPQSVRKPYPGVVQAFGILLLVFIATIAILLMISIPANALGIAKTDQISFVCFTAMMVVLVFTYRQTKVSFREVFKVKTFSPMYVLPIIITIIGISVIASEIDNISRLLVPMPPGLFDFMRKIATLRITSWTKIVFTILLIPVLEEALFRGVILRGFLKRYSTKKAIIVSALLFGVAHLNPWNMVPVFMGGIFLAWLMVSTRSIFTCILGHMTFNAIPCIVFSFLGLQIRGYSGMPTETVQFQPWWFDMMGVVMICVGIVGIIFLKKKQRYGSIQSATHLT
jgi:membrane protease YdiL (CAAX protease family)